MDYDLETQMLLEALREAKQRQDIPQQGVQTKQFGDVMHVAGPTTAGLMGDALARGFGQFQEAQTRQQQRDLSAQQQGEFEGALKELMTPGTKQVEGYSYGQGPLADLSGQPRETISNSPLEESQRRLGVYSKMSRLPMARGLANAGIKSEVDFPERQALLEQQQAQSRELALQRLDAQRQQNETANFFKAVLLGQGQQRIDQQAQRITDQRSNEQAKIEGKAAEAQQKVDSANALAEQGIMEIDAMIGKRDPKTGQLLEGEKPHPGFSSFVGFTMFPGARFVEGTDTAGFQARHNQITGQARLEGVQAMKGTGAVSNAEGEAAAKAITRMSKSQSENEYVQAALEYRAIMQKGIDRRNRGVRVGSDGNEYSASASSQGAAPQGAPQGAPQAGQSKTAVYGGKTYVQDANGKWWTR